MPDGKRLMPTELVRGPWRPDAQHGGPPSALLGRAVEAEARRRGGQVARLGVELVRPVPLVAMEVDVSAEEVSRRVVHVQAELRGDGEVVARTTALVLVVAELEAVQPPSVPDLPGAEATVIAPGWEIEGGLVVYHRDAVEHRFVEGGFGVPGPAVDWVRLRVPLVAGEDTSGLCRVLATADFGSGISAVFDTTSPIGLINADLTVALHRAPRGEWVRLDSRTMLGPAGVGLCTTTLGDEEGPLGTATQSLMALTRAGAR